MELTQLPAVNASLNGLAGVFLLLAYRAIRAKRIVLHRGLMLSAFACSTLFLASYVTYHLTMESPKFPGKGLIRVSYLAMLLSHIVLAALLLPLAIATLVLGLRRRDSWHRAVARWTFPIWMYVSVTGVAVYMVIYQIYGLSPVPKSVG